MNNNELFSVVFACILIYFVIKHDWSKHPNLRSWFPYIFFALLVVYIINYLLIQIDVDVWQQVQSKDLLQTWLERFGS
ncbi:MAG: hypothetical protein LBV08_11515 [Clostridiales bacterium]|nr:hypothetical protein [Clostridiales bacterium]